MIALGGAIGTGLFNGSGQTISVAGPSIILVYAIIGFFVFFLMRAMGEMLLSNLAYKSFRDIAEDKLGVWAGFFSGWTYWLCWIANGLADTAAMTNYVLWWFPQCPKFLPGLVLVALLFILNVIAVRIFGEVEFWFALIKIAAIGALILVAGGMILTGFHSDLSTLIGQRSDDAVVVQTLTQAYPGGVDASLGNLLNTEGGGVFPNGLRGFIGGFQIAFFAFTGVELAGTAAAETENPRKSLPKAINSIPLRVGLFYIVALAAILSVTPYLAVDPSVSPFVNMFGLTGLGFAASVVNFVVLTAAASSMNSGIYSASRMMFGLSLSRLAPKAFSILSRSGVPIRALIFSCLFILPGIGLLYASSSVMGAFMYAASASNVLFMFVWILIVVSYLAYRRATPALHAASNYKMPGGVVMSVIVLMFFAAMLVVLCLNQQTLIGVLATLVWFVALGIAYGARLMARRNRSGASRRATPRD
jgi:D-serine/D-alanine/glycine transporter